MRSLSTEALPVGGELVEVVGPGSQFGGELSGSSHLIHQLLPAVRHLLVHPLSFPYHEHAFDERTLGHGSDGRAALAVTCHVRTVTRIQQELRGKEGRK